jgi:RNA polymerase sigma-70 factor (ECF subfamily)
MRLLARRPREAEGARADDACDTDLVAVAQADPLAFDRLFARYDAPILNYCYYRLGSWEEAEDAAQEIFTNAYAGLPRFRDRDGGQTGTFRSWLFTIAHHEVVNRKRGHARHPNALLEAANAVPDPGPTPEELAVAADHQGRVLALVSRLSVDQRQVLELRVVGLTDVEIGAVLGRSAGAVRAVQARGVARLRDLLGIRPIGKGGGDV